MGKYREDYGEPWRAERSEMLPTTVHPEEDGLEARDEVRIAARGDAGLANWLLWAKTKFKQDIVAFTRPRKGRTGHDKIARRIAECVNACAGLDDPAQALKLCKEVMRALALADPDEREQFEAVQLKALKAWCLLEPKEREPSGWEDV